MNDIKLLKKRIQELEQKEQLFKETEKAGRIGGWRFDPESLEQFWSDEIFRILEIDLSHGAPKVPEGLGFIDDDFRPLAEKAVERAMKYGEPYSQEWRITTSKGNKKWVQAICQPVVENKKVIYVSGSFQDITSRKYVEEGLVKSQNQLKSKEKQLRASNHQLEANEQQLRAANQQLQRNELQLKATYNKLAESEKQFRELFENMSQGFALHEMIYDENNNPIDYRFLHINKSFEKLTGVKASEYIGKTVKQVIPKIEQIWIDNYGKVAKTAQPIQFEHYAQEFDKYYNVTAYSPKKGFFATVFTDTTKEKTQRKQLLDNQFYLSKAQEIGNIGTWELDLLKNQLIWTDENYRIFGIPIGTPMTYELFLNCVHPDDREYVNVEWSNAVLENKPYDIEHRLLLGDQVKWVREKANIEYNEDGNAIKAIGFTQDITKQKQSETETLKSKQKAEENEIRYRNLVETASDGIYLISEKGILIDANQGAMEMLGKERAEIVGQSIVSVDPSYPVEEFLNFWKDIPFNQQQRFETSHQHKNGDLIPVEVSAKKYQQEGKTYYYSLARDITERKLSEKALKENEELLQRINKRHSAMIENIGDVIAIVDADGMNLYQSPNVEKWFGWKPEELLGNSWDKIHHENVEMIQQEFTKILESDQTFKFEYRFKCKDGSYKPIELTATNFLNDPIIGGILLNYHDISERKQVEAEMREKDLRYKTFLDTNMDGFWITDLKGNIIDANDAYGSMSGYSKKELLGMHISDLEAIDSPKIIEERIQKLLIHGKDRFSSQHNHKNGHTFDVNVNIQYFPYDGGQFVCFFHDITELKNKEEALIKAKHLLNETGQIAKVGGWEIDLSGNTLAWTEETFRIHELSEENQPDVTNAINFYHPDDREKIALSVKNSIKTGLPFDIEARLITMKGKQIYVRAVGKAISNKGKTIGLRGIIQDITERKRIETELLSANAKAEENLERLNLIIKGSADAPWDWDFANKEIYYSPQWWAQIGYKPDELEVHDQLWYELTHPEDRKVVDSIMEEALTTNLLKYQVEFRLKHKLGHFVPVLSRGIISRDKDHHIVRITGSNQDLSEIKRTEAELIKAKEKAEESKANVTAIIEGTNNSIWAFDHDYKLLYINNVMQREFIESFGIMLEPGLNLIEELPDQLKPIWKPRYDRVLANEQFRIEDAVPTEKGILYIEVTFNPILKNGKVIGGSCFGQDITYRKQAEIELNNARIAAEESQVNITSIIEGSSNSIWAFNTNYEILYINKLFQEEFLKSFGVLLKPGMNLLESHPEPLIPLWKPRYDRVLANEQFIVEDAVQTENGVVYVEVSFNPIVKNGKVIGGSCLGADITTRRVSEFELTKAKENAEEKATDLKLAQQIANIGNWHFDPELGYPVWSDYIYKIYERDPRDGVPHIDDYKNIYEPDQYEKFNQAFVAAIKEGKAYDIELMLKFSKGRIKWVRAICKPDKKRKSKAGYYLSGTIQDITKSKNTELELQRAKEKAESANIHKNYFLANMSHEIRTPMNGVLGFTNLLLEENFIAEERNRYLHIIERNSQQLLTLIDDIIDVAKIESNELKVSISDCKILDIFNDLEENFNQIKLKLNKEQIELKMEIPSNYQNLVIKTDGHRLRQVISNLLNNAFKFSEKGTITFGFKVKKSIIEFYVSDQGIGIPKEKLSEIFERFKQLNYKNAAKYGGTGLGLAISRGIINLLGGDITVKSEQKAGSTFLLHLPIGEKKK